MLSVQTQFTPIRALEGQKEPVVLDVYINNKGEDTKLISVVVKAPFSLGFDKTGLMRESRKRVGYIKPNTEKVVPFQIYCKPMVKAGEYPVEVSVFTHPDRWDQTDREYRANTSLRVISR
jgi:uncharacterized membrane protein